MSESTLVVPAERDHQLSPLPGGASHEPACADAPGTDVKMSGARGP
jgi:hypothetical protein